MRAIIPTSIKRHWVLGLILLAGVLAVQLSHIQRPYFGHFASYQNVVMASVSRNMIRENFTDLLNPKTEVLVAHKKSLHLNQYPTPSLIAALGSRYVGGSLEFWGRFQAVLFNLCSILLIGLIATRLKSPDFGWITATIFAFSPFTLIYGQMFMCEPIALCSMLLSLFLLLPKDSSAEPSMVRITLAGLAFAITLLSRIHYLIFIPCCYFMIVKRFTFSDLFKTFWFTFVSFAMATPWYAYTYYMTHHCDYVMTSMFLQGEEWKFFDRHFLRQPEYWKRIFDAISQTMLTPLLFSMFLLGFFSASRRSFAYRLALMGILLGFSLVLIWPSKLVEHDFYLYGAFPFVCLMTAFAIEAMGNYFPVLKKKSAIVIVVLLYLFVSARYFSHPIFKYPEQNLNFLKIATSLDRQIGPNDRIAVLGANAPDLFYYLNRPGGALEFTGFGKGLPKYMYHKTRSAAVLRELKEFADAKDPIALLECCVRHGTVYLITTSREELDKYPEVLSYLKRNYQEITSQAITPYCYAFRFSVPQKKHIKL